MDRGLIDSFEIKLNLLISSELGVLCVPSTRSGQALRDHLFPIR
jgi:hypothetical protein